LSSKPVVHQHFVPRVYLRNFTSEPKAKNPLIHAFLKNEGRTFSNGIDRVAEEKFFYDTDSDHSSQPVEKYLSDIEGVFGSTIRRILVAYRMTPSTSWLNRDVIREEDRAELAWYIALQMMRTPAARKLMTDVKEKAITAFARTKIKSGKLRNLRIKLKDDSLALNHVEFMMDADHLGEMALKLCDLTWAFGVNQSKIPFYTSDNPVVAMSYDKQYGPMPLGLSQPGLELSFPLSNDLILILRDPKYFSDETMWHNRFVPLDDDWVMKFNELQVRVAHRMVLCRDDNFDFAREISSDPKPVWGRLNIKHINKMAKQYFGEDTRE
jgi:hypothetical protein